MNLWKVSVSQAHRLPRKHTWDGRQTGQRHRWPAWCAIVPDSPATRNDEKYQFWAPSLPVWWFQPTHLKNTSSSCSKPPTSYRNESPGMVFMIYHDIRMILGPLYGIMDDLGAWDLVIIDLTREIRTQQKNTIISSISQGGPYSCQGWRAIYDYFLKAWIAVLMT